MASAPTGTVALVFTDVEGSTTRWELEGMGFRALFDRHDSLVRDAIVEHRGYEVKTEGDAFMVAFADSRDAVAFAAAAQARLASESWNGEPLRVRMGVHMGDPLCRPDPVHGRMDYFGPVVNRAARICAAGHGSQVVISDDVAQHLGSRETLQDLGEHELRGVGRPTRLWQVGDARFPPLRTPKARRSNLPAEPDHFVGRQPQVAAIQARLDRGARLITLLGTGGSGKTRLAIRASSDRVDGLEGGVWWVDLTEARTVEGICGATASALDLTLRGDPVDPIARALATRGPTLLVLDNCENGVEALLGPLETWLARAPGLQILATSRIALGARGEVRFDVDPLPVDDGVALFVERARVPLDPSDASLRELVQRLDGLPLAIELAAARSVMLTPKALLERMDRRFSLLGGRRSSRRKTLRAVIDESWELLPEWGRAAFAQLAVFEGGFAADAAEAVLDLSQFDDEPMALDALELLLDHSLIRRTSDGGIHRFGLLETLRAYAAEKLQPQERTAAELRHAQHYAWASKSEMDLLDSTRDADRVLFNRELDNAVAAARRMLAAGRIELAGRLVWMAWSVFYMRGPYSVGEALIREALAHPDLSGEMRRGFLRNLSLACAIQARYDDAYALNTQLLEDANAAGDVRAQTRALGDFGSFAREQGRIVEAQSYYERALQGAEQAGDVRQVGICLANLGVVTNSLGRADEAAALYEKAMGVLRGGGSARSVATIVANLANIRAEQGRIDEARALYHEADRLREQIGDRARGAMNLSNLGLLEIEQGNFDLGRSILQRALKTHTELGAMGFRGLTLANLGRIDKAEGRWAAARERLVGGREILEDAGWSMEVAVCTGVLAELDRLDGKLDEADAGFRIAEAALREVDESPEMAILLADMAALDLDRGDGDAAAARLAEADKIAATLNAGDDSLIRRRIAEVRAYT